MAKNLDQMRDAIHLKHYSYRTEEYYIDWARRFILFHNKRHPKDMGAAEINIFLTHLATHFLRKGDACVTPTS
jgi:hypothetical protein